MEKLHVSASWVLRGSEGLCSQGDPRSWGEDPGKGKRETHRAWEIYQSWGPAPALGCWLQYREESRFREPL